LVHVVEGLWLGADFTTTFTFIFALGFGSPPRVLAVAGSAAGFTLGFVFSALQQRGD